MKPVLFLRIASGLAFLHAVAHTVGGVFGKPAAGLQANTVAVMKANQFPVMGVTRSYWDFQMGMGLGISIDLLVATVVFWQLSSLARTQATRLRPLLITFMAGYLALAVNSFRYFFAGPVIGEILIALCLGLAILTHQRGQEEL